MLSRENKKQYKRSKSIMYPRDMYEDSGIDLQGGNEEQQKYLSG